MDICYSSGIWLSQLCLYLQASKRGILLNLHYTTLFEYLQVLSCWHGVWAFYLLTINLYFPIQELFAVEIEACVDHTFPWMKEYLYFDILKYLQAIRMLFWDFWCNLWQSKLSWITDSSDCVNKSKSVEPELYVLPGSCCFRFLRTLEFYGKSLLGLVSSSAYWLKAESKCGYIYLLKEGEVLCNCCNSRYQLVIQVCIIILALLVGAGWAQNSIWCRSNGNGASTSSKDVDAPSPPLGTHGILCIF